MADGDTESARSEDVPADHAEHNVIQEGPVSSDSESDQEISEAGDEEPPSIEEVAVEVGDVRAAALRAEVDLRDIFQRRGSVMKFVPRFLRGPFKNALKVAMEAALQEDEFSQERCWKLFVMLPRMLLHRQQRRKYCTGKVDLSCSPEESGQDV